MAIRAGVLLDAFTLITAILSKWQQIILRPQLLFSLSRRVNYLADEIAKSFEFSNHDAQQAVGLFLRQMDEGLRQNGTSLSQLPTFVTALPTGKEKGLYLAVDLGGTNLRVCSIQLAGNKTIVMTPPAAVDIPIPQERMEGCTASELFGWVAEEVSKFLLAYHGDDLENHNHGEPYRLGFAFSHAYEQQGIKKGILLRWSKAFNIPDAVGKDICALLQTELDNLKLPVLVTALVNDTTGTLLARAYEAGGEPKTVLGAIFGTGTNGAYFEGIEAIQKLDLSLMPIGTCDSSTGEMIINTEWGAFDDEMILLPDTDFDRAVDASSVNPRQEMFEKRISGLYLGEILRHVILQLYSNRSSWREQLPRPTALGGSPLNSPWEIDASFLSALASEGSEDIKYTDRVVKERLRTHLDNKSTFLASAAIRKVSLAIARRAARLAGVAIAAIVIRSGLLERSQGVGQEPDKASIVQEEALNSNTHDLEGLKSPLYSVNSGTVTPPKRNGLRQTLTESLQKFFHPASETSHTQISQNTTVQPLIDIGVTGSLWQKYPHFEDMVRELLREIPGIGPEGEKRIRIGIAENGSLVGAALGAALGNIDST